MAKTKSAKVSLVEADRNWQAEQDLRTLQEHHAITKDAQRHAAAKELAKKKLMEMAKIATDPDKDPKSEPDADGDE